MPLLCSVDSIKYTIVVLEDDEFYEIIEGSEGTVKCLSEDPSPEGGVITLSDTWPSELVQKLKTPWGS